MFCQYSIPEKHSNLLSFVLLRAKVISVGVELDHSNYIKFAWSQVALDKELLCRVIHSIELCSSECLSVC
jgi:hypothetical protein